VVRELERLSPDLHVVQASAKKRSEAGWEEVDFLCPETFGPALQGVDRGFLMRPPALASVDRQFAPFFDALSSHPFLRAVVFLSLQGADTMPWVPLPKSRRRRGSETLLGRFSALPFSSRTSLAPMAGRFERRMS